MGHIKNLQGFEQLIAVCTGFGGAYNPGKANLQLESMSSMLSNARNALRQVIEAQTEFNNATDSREVTFGKLNKLATRIVGELSSSGALEQTVDQARSVIRQMAGRKRADRGAIPSGNAETPAATEPRTRASGKDFATKEYFFEQLLELLASEPQYQPQVEELKIQSLRERLTTLRNENASVAVAAARLGKARRDRNTLLYLDASNLYDTARAVKQQVKAIYGFGSEAHRAASSILFNKPVKP